MIGQKNKVVTQLKGGIKQLLTANGVKQFAGVASFKDRSTITIAASGAGVSPASPLTLSAKKIIIATGSTSVMPGFLPKHERVVESRGFLDLDAAARSPCWCSAADSSAASWPAWRRCSA